LEDFSNGNPELFEKVKYWVANLLGKGDKKFTGGREECLYLDPENGAPALSSSFYFNEEEGQLISSQVLQNGKTLAGKDRGKEGNWRLMHVS